MYGLIVIAIMAAYLLLSIAVVKGGWSRIRNYGNVKSLQYAYQETPALRDAAKELIA